MLNPSHLHNAVILSPIDDGGRDKEEEETVVTTTVEESPKPEPVPLECVVSFGLFIVIVFGIAYFLKKVEVW